MDGKQQGGDGQDEQGVHGSLGRKEREIRRRSASISSSARRAGGGVLIQTRRPSRIRNWCWPSVTIWPSWVWRVMQKRQGREPWGVVNRTTTSCPQLGGKVKALRGQRTRHRPRPAPRWRIHRIERPRVQRQQVLQRPLVVHAAIRCPQRMRPRQVAD